MKIDVLTAGRRHYSEAVAREILLTVKPVKVTAPDGTTHYLFIGPSERAPLEHERRPKGRGGPILIAVRAAKLAEGHWRVFHCFRVRGKDRRDWAAGGR